MLSIEGLDAFYGKAQILYKINLSVNEGDILAILGRNGVGKTTLLKAIMGIEVNRKGRVLLRGMDISRMKTHEISRMGVFYVPDDAGLFPGMTVLENLRLAAGKMRVELSALEEIYPEVRSLLNRRADLLSGGERKIIAILRCLLTDTGLLLLDEPTEGVMPVMVKKIYSMLVRLKEMGKTIVVVESGIKLNAIADTATKISIMSGGKIIYTNKKEAALEELELIKKHLFV